jgi:hypothetical protein
MNKKIVGNWEIDRSPIPDQFIAFSEAYLDSASRLCKILKLSTRKRSYPRGAVVLFLTFHSIELFLKAAILLKYPKDKLHHNVERLMGRYKELYPEKQFDFEIPFKTEYIGFEPSHKKPAPPMQDQLSRYPIGKNYETWPGAIAFEPESFLSIIESLQIDFHRLKEEIFG